MQNPGPIPLVVGCFFIPYSPRQLTQNDWYEKAEQDLWKSKAIDKVIDIMQCLISSMAMATTTLYWKKMRQIRSQIAYERSQEDPWWVSAMMRLFSRRYLHRTTTAACIVTMGQLSGSSVVQNFQNIFYLTLVFTGGTSLLISGFYGMMVVVGEFIYSFVSADRWPRTTTLWSGSLVLSILISILMSLSAQFGTKGAQPNGARAAIAMIFIYSASFAVSLKPLIYVVPSALLPFFLGAMGHAFAVFVKAITAIVLSQVTPVAMQEVSWRYYSLFIAPNAFAAARIYFFFLPETGCKTLEEIADLFGDTIATDRSGEIDVSEEGSDEH